jgi:glutamate-1-semialdehyde 2,1-aminomutase
VSPDLTTFGKVIGGGLPIGSVGGRREIMETLSPLGPVFHAGTLAGNPLATAAGRAALNELSDDVYAALGARAQRLSALLGQACAAAGIAATFPVVGTLVGMYFGSGPAPTNFGEAKTTDEQVYRTFFHAMLAEGIALAPGAYEALFVGLAHTDDVLDAIGDAAGRAAAATAEQLG